jgi:hypothetical protein
MRLTRRTILTGSALTALTGKSYVICTGQESELIVDDLSDLVAEATYGGEGTFWRLHLFANYSARLSVQFRSATTGTVFGQFRFYDIEVADRQQLAAFANLRTMIAAPEPEIHPWTYGISLAIPKSRELHRVKVYVGSSVRVSNELRVFFAIWQNIWKGIPGAPSVPTGYLP